VRLRLRAARCSWQDSQRIGSKLRHSPFQCFQLRIQLLATPTTRLIASFYPPGANHLRSQSRYRTIAKEVSGYEKKSRLLQSSSALRVAVPVISTASARLSRVAMSRSISPQSRISRRLAPGGPASHGRPRNAVSPIRNCQNRRMDQDPLRKGQADSGLARPE
jgi:hypothetical protein